MTTITIVCPDCDGEGCVEVMTWLTYDGDQTWRREVCETCHGSGEIEVEIEDEEDEE